MTLKAAYAVPNALSNLGLHLVQAGWAAPRNLARAVRLNHYAGPEVMAAVDALMGEGLTSALRSEHGIASKAATAAANFWGKGVDVPFRRASFLHEASVRGFKTPEQLRELVSDPALRDKLLEVTHEANRDLIDYGDLSPFERDVVRRVVFLYPWVKGSTKYAGRFATSHPIQSAAAGQLGQLGAKEQESLGPLPSYAEGLIPAGHGRTLNPTSAAVFGTPSDLVSTVENTLSGNLGQAFRGSDLLSPAAQTLVELITGRDDLGRPLEGNPLQSILEGMGASVPLYNTWQQLQGHPSKSYPMTPKQALLAALFSRATVPVNTDQETLNYIAGLQRHPR